MELLKIAEDELLEMECFGDNEHVNGNDVELCECGCG